MLEPRSNVCTKHYAGSKTLHRLTGTSLMDTNHAYLIWLWFSRPLKHKRIVPWVWYSWEKAFCNVCQWHVCNFRYLPAKSNCAGTDKRNSFLYCCICVPVFGVSLQICWNWGAQGYIITFVQISGLATVTEIYFASYVPVCGVIILRYLIIHRLKPTERRFFVSETV